MESIWLIDFQPVLCGSFDLLAFAYQGQDIVFRFVIEFSSLRDLIGP